MNLNPHTIYAPRYGQPVKGEDIAYEVIRRMAHRLLDDDTGSSAPPAVIPTLPAEVSL